MGYEMDGTDGITKIKDIWMKDGRMEEDGWKMDE